MRDAFLGILSHELRTPITTIYGGTRVLSRPGLSEETRREVSDDISVEAERLHRLVEDLLVLARTERGTLQRRGRPGPRPAPASPAIVESEGAPLAGHPVRAPHRPNLPTVSADPTYVEQIIRNLVGNGAKYSPGGATVTVQAEQVEGFVDLRILDEGPGIASDEVDRLFELFYRSPTTAAQSAGAGHRPVRVSGARRGDGRSDLGQPAPDRRRRVRVLAARPGRETTSDGRNERGRAALRPVGALQDVCKVPSTHLTMLLRPPATHAGPHRCRWTAGCGRRTIATAQGHRLTSRVRRAT